MDQPNTSVPAVASTLDFDISQRPDYALLSVKLKQGEKIFSEPSAMASMDTTVKLRSGMKGGFGGTLGRALGGESMIINTFTAESGPGEVTFAPGSAGDTVHHHLNPSSQLLLQRGAFMCHSEGVEVTGKWQGAKGFFSGEGMVLLQASGQGDIFFNSYGAIIDVDVKGDFYVDTGYIVAFENTLQYQVTTLPGLSRGGKLKSFVFGGEGLVCRFSGQGKLWIQTRCAHPFLSWVEAFRPVKSKS